MGLSATRRAHAASRIELSLPVGTRRYAAPVSKSSANSTEARARARTRTQARALRARTTRGCAAASTPADDAAGAAAGLSPRAC